MRVGNGIDVHRLVPGRELVLGGVNIPFEKGLLGHSDADVLIHAICDALLGAAALGDLGHHFPDRDPSLEGVSSLVILKKTGQMIRGAAFDIGHIDVTVIAEAPKMAPYRGQMIENISSSLVIDPGSVSIKATTTEGLGLFGRGEGIGAMCTVVLHQPSS